MNALFVIRFVAAAGCSYEVANTIATMYTERMGHNDELIDNPRFSSTDSMQVAMATELLDTMHAQIRAADEKIRALFSATALLAAALSFTTQQQFSQLLNGGWSRFVIAEFVARGLLFVAIASAAIAAVLALMPRVRGGRASRSLFFFGDIADTPSEAFIHEFQTLTEEAAVQQILSQVHVNARIVRAKYVWTGRAATGFLAAIMLWIVVQLITFLG